MMVVYLGWFDLDFYVPLSAGFCLDCMMGAQILLRLMGVWQNWLCRWGR